LDTTEAQVIASYVTPAGCDTYRSAGNWVSDNANSQTLGNDTESRDSAEAGLLRPPDPEQVLANA